MWIIPAEDYGKGIEQETGEQTCLIMVSGFPFRCPGPEKVPNDLVLVAASVRLFIAKHLQLTNKPPTCICHSRGQLTFNLLTLDVSPDV